MKTPKVFESEYRFCLILWENEPITCAKISDICKEKLGWARTTTYTVIKRLGDRGVLKKDGSTITSLVSKEEAQMAEIDDADKLRSLLEKASGMMVDKPSLKIVTFPVFVVPGFLPNAIIIASNLCKCNFMKLYHKKCLHSSVVGLILSMW